MHTFLLLLAARVGWFAEGRFLGRVLDEWTADTQEFIRLKLPHLLVVAGIAFLLNRLLRLITFQMTRVAERHAAAPGHLSQVKTMAGVLRTTGHAIIWLISGLQILAALGVNLAPLLASAGVAGIAIGLAAQNIVKDMLNGILILIENQFDVGDSVRLAGVAGTVEAMTLRKTSIRDYDGTLYTIPNSQITTVANQSVGYSLATVNVSVDFSANPDQVMEILRTVALEIRNSEEFSPLFLDEPRVLGVDAVKGSEIVFAVVFKTMATRQFAPIREFRRRVRLALEAHHLLPGDPNRVFQTFADRRSQPTPDSSQENDPTTLKPEDGSPFKSES